MSGESLKLQRQGAILVITINRPERLNAIDTSTRNLLEAAWKTYNDDKCLRAAIITGAGTKAFCSGMDVKEAASSSVAELWKPREGKAEKVWKPIICAVNGICAGDGLGLIINSDIAICTNDAIFIDPHVSIGQVAAVQAIGLSRRIPLQAVMRMALMGSSERLTANDALGYGLVSEITGDDQLMPRALAIAEAVSSNSPAAVLASKQAILQGLDLGYSSAIDNGMSILQNHWSHPDHIEGPRAFAEKRDPHWKT